MVTHDPLHGSGRAALPHPALALGNDAHAAHRIGMIDEAEAASGDQPPHAVPADMALLAAPRQRTLPQPAQLDRNRKSAG